MKINTLLAAALCSCIFYSCDKDIYGPDQDGQLPGQEIPEPETPEPDWSDIVDGPVLPVNWMGHLTDRSIANINMPGTHDSGTVYVASPTYSQTQDHTIAEQLDFGTRFFDLRINWDDKLGEFTIVHGTSQCYTDASSSKTPLPLAMVLGWCYDFLTANPSETIVLEMMQQKSKISDVDVRLKENYIDQNPEAWFLENRIPSLNEVRGKIVMIHRFDLTSVNTLGIDLRTYIDLDGKENAVEFQINGTQRAWIQDSYKYSNGSEKWFNTVVGALAEASSKNNDMYINMFNATGKILGKPRDYAAVVNGEFQKYGLKQGRKYGWLGLDFITEELAAKIYESNVLIVKQEE